MASLIEDLARRLDVSPDQARQQLQQLTAQLHQQMQREGQASLPGLGTFSQKDETWTFEPTSALARSVNRSFDDLEPVGVSSQTDPSAAQAAGSTPADEEKPPRPSHEDAPSEKEPLESEPPSKETPEQVTGSSIFDRQEEHRPEDDPPARGLFSREPSDTEEDTDESAMPASESSGDVSSPPDEEPSKPSTPPSREAPSSEPPSETTRAGEDAPPAQHAAEKDAWALPDQPSSEESDTSASLWDYAALPAGYLVHRSLGVTSDDLHSARLQAVPPAPSDRPPTPATPERDEERSISTRREEKRSRQSTSDRRSSTPSRGRPPQEAAQRSKKSSGRGWLVALLILLVAGLGVWYVLGQQGVTTGPLAMFEQEAPTEEASTPTSEEPAASTPGTPSSETPSTGEAAPATSNKETAPQPSPAEQAYNDAPRLDREQGGWTVVVASETSRDAARTAAQRFAQRFQEQGYPIDIVASTVNDTRRFRVVVGQFDSSDQVLQTINENADRFPEDAWALELGSGS